MGNYGNGSEQWWWLWEKTNLYFFHGRQWQWRRVPVCVLDGWSCHQHQWQPPTKWNLLNRRQSSFPGKGYKCFFFNRWYCATEICKWLLSLRSQYLADTKLFFIVVVFINILTLEKGVGCKLLPKIQEVLGSVAIDFWCWTFQACFELFKMGLLWEDLAFGNFPYPMSINSPIGRTIVLDAY